MAIQNHPHKRFRLLTFIGIVIAGTLSFAASAHASDAVAAPRPNVLFIAVDDLNHWVGHLGRNKQTRTPNIDRLAKLGITFTNAHCAAPVCNPSRAALLSGLRPSTTGVYDNNNPYVGTIESSQSLVSQFKADGYKTLGMGKLWHGGLGFADQWSETGGREQGDRTGALLDDRSIGGIRFGILNADDSAVPDTHIADYGIAQLQKTHDAPFFLTLGFHKPHMPWNVPKKYFDMHPLEQIELPPVLEGDLSDVPSAGLKMARAEGDHAEVLKSGRWKEAVQAYLAAISYLDGQVGRVLDALEKSPHRDNTIICFWGDHGWHLGEKQHWRKFALWEEATRAPLIFVAPGVTTAGSRCDRPVDFMSIYPTVCELSSIPVPAHVEGRSIVPLLKDPAAAWDGVALTTFGKNNHAVRSDRWRYIRYADGGEELYDHQTDPYEWKNLAADTSLQSVKTELAAMMPKTNAEPVKKADTDEADTDNAAPVNNKNKNKNKARKNQKKKQAAQENSPTTTVASAALSAASPVKQAASSPAATPNIVWVIIEDMSANFSCYGEKNISTPNLDALAKKGTRFTHAFVTAPICSISRSALITGRYQTSIGCQNHRSSVPGHVITLPDRVQLVPAMLRNAGYHVNNLTVEQFLRTTQDVTAKPDVPVAKTDYNFQWDQAATYDRTHWAARPNGKPFFVQVQLHGGKHRGQGNGT
ncbi:MAG: sulfatase-like hydrolase/transferase, partial [Planctomycetaceae bacterium]|nr:sulfatase-like hydrolase/transferase [Planctomycetaceae bacterium]